MSDDDGTDIPDDDAGMEPIGSCDGCDVNIYAENADTGLCDACEFAVAQTKVQRCAVCGCSTKACTWSTGSTCEHGRARCPTPETP